MTYWLISKENAGIIKQGLLASMHRANDFNCPDDSPSLGECSGCAGDKLRAEALHCLSSGLHITKAIPDDFKEAG
jgi:hypothetical protein